MRIKQIGAVIALTALNFLFLALVWGAPIPGHGKGNSPQPSVTPALTPYPDPSHGGVGTWQPKY